MSKYTPEKNSLILKNIKFYPDQVKAVSRIHNNFSEFVRDALDEKIDKESKILEESLKKLEAI